MAPELLAILTFKHFIAAGGVGCEVRMEVATGSIRAWWFIM